METTSVKIYSRYDKLPALTEGSFMHSSRLFGFLERISGYTPYMIVVSDAAGAELCHLLAIVRRRGSWMPPYLYSHCRIYGEGVYTQYDDRNEELFDIMLHALTNRMSLRCLYVEFSNLGSKMFAYKYFKRQNYFAVHWMDVHNSLHSHTPEERLSDKMTNRINGAYGSGVTAGPASPDDIDECLRMLKNFYKIRLRRYCPPGNLFKILEASGDGKIFATKYKGHVIGTATCLMSEGNAYMGYLACSNRFPLQHAKTMTVWSAIKYAESIRCEHIYFLDVGLPFRKNPYRDFILKFGGKPTSTNRWFHFNISIINKVLKWIYQ